MYVTGNKCTGCKKRCKCRFCPYNNECKYALRRYCKAVAYCGKFRRFQEENGGLRHGKADPKNDNGNGAS